ncbi:PadR family transcriptional regulator [Amorphoplanes digitatis]|uniref:DNA-binding PadR family transcriptional regulator n=1 Tax=Actinoplanes digitatis TaxID=1868 RepID=A0A7W7HSY3_9ACTN|nr:PadR family transcriptional regulator [Actinoplanes digitatis]MBB4760212.1 DNA-binding PadR family transcriptional regulator [Actinoplanes digitatis]BFE68292.1 PadR family transcriptional regulator [Actinoplanes digitatis]GID94776.1 PadR family transcriptional regulator [Actinoplanes digitatis]
MTSAEPRRSTLAMMLLALLAEAPMHPYRMQQMIKERGQDQLVNVAQRNSVYQALDRLVRDGLARPGGTTREPGRPERTVYEITPAGSATLRRWLTDMLPTPAREFPEFPAALAFLPILDPAEVRALLERRIAALREKVAQIQGQAPPGLPRLFLIEDEYRAAMLGAELTWLGALVDDLASGRLTWDENLINQTLAEFS